MLVAADLVLAVASTLPLAMVAVMLQGAAFGGPGGREQPDRRSRPTEPATAHFGVNFTLLNPIGIGGIVGGLFVDVDQPRTFRSSTSPTRRFLPVLYIMLIPLRHLAGRPVHENGEAPPRRATSR
jgi:hypothetical protein